VIALNERHLKRLVCEYVRYYHEDRTHLGWPREPIVEGRRSSVLASTTRQPAAPLRPGGCLRSLSIY
jgi:hypothetical protein